MRTAASNGTSSFRLPVARVGVLRPRPRDQHAASGRGTVLGCAVSQNARKVARYGPKRRIDRRTLSTKLPWNPSHAPPKAKARKHDASGPSTSNRLAVVVHLELQRSRAQAGRHDLVIHLVADVGVDQVVGEHATLGEELIVILQGLQRALQGG